MPDRVVLAYSGGLDTSVAVRWLSEHEGVEVVAVAVNVGQAADPAARIGTPSGPGRWPPERSRRSSSTRATRWPSSSACRRCRPTPATRASTLSSPRCPGLSSCATSWPRPRRHGATAVGHGCTGKGNDQVRFEVGVRALAPDLGIYAPARVWGLTREDCVELAAKWEIPITVTKEKLYSIDDNLWGKAIECGAIEDPWAPAPDDVYTLTRVDRDRAGRGRRAASRRGSPSASTARPSRPTT